MTTTVTHHVTIGDYEFPVQIEIDYQPEEPEEQYYPGCPEGVEYSVRFFDHELPQEHPIVKELEPSAVLELYEEAVNPHA